MTEMFLMNSTVGGGRGSKLQLLEYRLFLQNKHMKCCG